MQQSIVGFLNKTTFLNIYPKEVTSIRNVVFVHKLNLVRYNHHYTKIIPWSSTLEFSEELIKSVIYEDNNLLVLNKPYGVSFSRDSSNNAIDKKSNNNSEEDMFKKTLKNQPKIVKNAYRTSGVVSDTVNIVECLPYLKKHFGLEKLYIGRVPEKYASGVAIFTKSKEYVEFINKCRLHAPTGKDKYLAVVAGTPRILESNNLRLGFKLVEHKKLGKRAILLEKWSNNAYKRGEIRIGTFHHRTISSGIDKLTSLVEISMQLRKYHAYRVFCSDYLLSPVLGDNLIGSRVQTVMGVPVILDPFCDVANTPQMLSSNTYRLLDLTPGNASLVPIHIHLAEMLLPRFFKDKTPLLLRASPPPHFLWTCEKLGLNTSTEERLESNISF